MYPDEISSTSIILKLYPELLGWGVERQNFIKFGVCMLPNLIFVYLQEEKCKNLKMQVATKKKSIADEAGVILQAKLKQLGAAT